MWTKPGNHAFFFFLPLSIFTLSTHLKHSGVSFICTIVPIVQLLKEKGLLPELSPQVENIVCSLDPDLQGAAAAVASILRQKGQSVDLVLENKPLKW